MAEAPFEASCESAIAAAEAAFAERLERHRERLETQRAGHLEATGRLEGARLRGERAAGDLRRGVDRLRAGVLARASAAADLRAAALEVAVHGWDISRACGQRRPIPPALAAGLLVIAPVLVPGTDRHPLFAAPVTVTTTASPSDRLAAFLGRTPAA